MPVSLWTDWTRWCPLWAARLLPSGSRARLEQSAFFPEEALQQVGNLSPRRPTSRESREGRLVAGSYGPGGQRCPSHPGSRLFRMRQWDGSHLPIHVVEYPNLDPVAITLVVLSFTGAHSRQMRPFAEAMHRSGFRLVLIDLPGHGRSGGPRGTFVMDQLFHVIRQVTDWYAAQHPQSPMGLLGSSWGGDLAILFALWEQHHLETVGKARTIDAVLAQAVITSWQREIFATFRPGVGLLFDPTGLGAKLARHTIGPRLGLAQMFRLNELYERPALRRDFARDPLRLRGYETESYLGYLTYQPPVLPDRLQIPLRIVVGQRDRLVTPDYERRVFEGLAAYGSDITLSLVPEASHGMFQENIGASVAVAAPYFHKQLSVPALALGG